MPDAKPYSISRVFNAPPALVFQANTQAEHLAKWMSPAGFDVIKANMDFKVGGTYHYGLKGPDGNEMWGKQVFVEIIPNKKVVHIQSFSDRDGGLTRHPMAPTWPLEMLATTTYEEAGPGKTKLTVTWAPYQSDETGNATFDGARAGMDQGWGGTFAKLEGYLSTLTGA